MKKSMSIKELPLPDFFKEHYASLPGLTPIQEKALGAGLLKGKSLLVCAPTASGKTLVATMAIVKTIVNRNINSDTNNTNNVNDTISVNNTTTLIDSTNTTINSTNITNCNMGSTSCTNSTSNSINNSINNSAINKQSNEFINGPGKAIYVVPLKALASEKFREYQKLLGENGYKTAISIRDIDSESAYLAKYDLIIMTSEKLDSLLRRKISWLTEVKTIIFDEIHLLNDPTRGPTLEIIITLLKNLIHPQLIGLSATIGNPEELAEWLEAGLVTDSWRPVELKQGIHCDGKIEFF